MSCTCREFCSPFVLQKNSTDYDCICCDEHLHGQEDLDSHVNSPSHNFATQMGFFIMPMEVDDFYCKFCNSIFSGYQNVFTHVRTEEHQNLLESEPKNVECARETIDWSSCKRFVSPFVVKKRDSEDQFFCLLCHAIIDGNTELDSHVDRHAEAVKLYHSRILPLKHIIYYCKCCNCRIEDHREVHSHLRKLQHQTAVFDLSKQGFDACQRSFDYSRQAHGMISFVPNFPRFNFSPVPHFFPAGPQRPPMYGNGPAHAQFPGFPRLYFPPVPHFFAGPQRPSMHGNGPAYAQFPGFPPNFDFGYPHRDFAKPANSCGKFLPLKSNTPCRITLPKAEKCVLSSPEMRIEIEDKSDETQVEISALPVAEERLQDSPAKPAQIEDKVTDAKQVELSTNSALPVAEMRPSAVQESLLDVEDDAEKRFKLLANSALPVAERLLSTPERQIDIEDEADMEQHSKTSLFDNIKKSPVRICRKKTEVANVDEKRSEETTNDYEKIIDYREKQSEHRPEVTRRREENRDTQTKQCLARKTETQEIERFFRLDEDIYNMHDRLQEIKRSMDLCFVTRSKRVYCLVCRKTVNNTLDNYIEHLRDLDHCDYLESMFQSFAQSSLDRSQFGELYLAYQYIEEMSKETTRCLVCEKNICSNDYALLAHMADDTHKENCEKMHRRTSQSFEDLESRMQCDWYKVQKYWCVPCSLIFDAEIEFVEHFRGGQHEIYIEELASDARRLIYDFCQHCALLWYGYRSTYPMHCEDSLHKWFLRNGNCVFSELPKAAKLLLIAPEKYVQETIKYLDHKASVNKRNQFILDLGNAVKFSRAKAYVFGSRVPDVRLPDGDIDVFLSCDNIYEGGVCNKDRISYFLTRVHECLVEDEETWEVKGLLVKGRSSIIKARHRATGFCGDISFESGLVVGGAQFIKFLNYVFSSYRKLILFLKQWLAYCNLSGSEYFTSCALYWCVIFCLQTESLLPSIDRLIATADKPMIADGKRTTLDDLIYDEAASNKFGLRELLIKFFTFYMNFDFRTEVACPLLGEAVKKQTFVESKIPPNQMAPCISYPAGNSSFEESFSNDSVMWLQNPFNPQHNITEGVSKACLSRFRICCAESFLVLCPSAKTH